MFTSSVNAIDLPKHIIYDANKQEAVSISVLGKYIAIAASTEICLHNLDDSKGQCGQTQVYIYHVSQSTGYFKYQIYVYRTLPR